MKIQDPNATAEAGEVAGDTGTAAEDVGVVEDAAGDEGPGADVVGAVGGVVGDSADLTGSSELHHRCFASGAATSNVIVATVIIL